MNLVSMAHWLYVDQNAISQLNNYRIAAKAVCDLNQQLVSMDAKSRVKLKGLDENRNDIIIPGSMIVNALIETFQIEDVILCNEAIREGIAYDYMQRNRSNIELESTVPNIRRRSVLQLANKCDYPEQHSRHVTELALTIFDQTQDLHKMDDVERELLEYAGLLHDIGYHIHYKKHHKHSYYLIKYGEMNGFEAHEIELIANIARYHCKGSPKARHEEWSQLSARDQKVARYCAAILRVADALDRSHFNVVKSLKCQLSNRELMFDLFAEDDPELEIWAAEQKKDLLEKVFKRKVSFHIHALEDQKDIINA